MLLSTDCVFAQFEQKVYGTALNGLQIAMLAYEDFVLCTSTIKISLVQSFKMHPWQSNIIVMVCDKVMFLRHA